MAKISAYFLLTLCLLYTTVSCINPFIEHLQQHLTTVEPCENFYRHVCPKDITANQTVVHRVLNQYFLGLAKKADQLRDQKVLEHGYDVENDVELRKYCKDPVSSRDDINICELLEKLRLRSVMLKSSKVRDALTLEEHVKFRRLTSNLLWQVGKTFSKSKLPKSTVDKVRKQNAIHQVNLGLNTEHYGSYEDAYDALVVDLKNRLQIKKQMNNTKDALVKFREGIHATAKMFFNMNELLILKVLSTGKYGAFNLPDDTSIPEGVLLMGVNATAPVLYGGVGQVIGHEVMHTLIHLDDVAYEKPGKCLMSHMQRTCKRYREKSCYSGEVTYSEDVADIEGTLIAYDTMKNAVGKRLKGVAVTVKERPITTQQLFFYANAILNCVDQKEVNQADVFDAHSARYVRINGIFSLMQGFAEAFKCKTQSTMMKLKQEAGSTQCSHVC